MDIGIRMYEFLAYIATSEPVATASFIYTVFGLISKFRSAERGEYHNILYIVHESGRSHVISIGSDFDEEEAREALESFLIRLEEDE
ncbi:hypothetical protein ES703_116244 [subsurface metagenome]